MTHKIYKYIYKINKALKTKNVNTLNKIPLYCEHLKRHNNMAGGSIVKDKINELEILLKKINSMPKFGINDALEKKLIDTETEFKLYDKKVSQVMTDIMSYHGLDEQAKKLFS